MTQTTIDAAALERCGSSYTPEQVDEILHGILGAPEEVHAQDSWLALIAPNPDEDLTSALRTRLATLAASSPEAPAPGSSARINAIREAMKAHDVTAFFIPRGDRYRGEYVPPCAERLANATGFTGSAGMAFVKLEGGGVFTDGRYSIQIKQQVNTEELEALVLGEVKLRDWLRSSMSEGDVIGLDTWLVTQAFWDDLEKKLEHTGVELRALDANLVDETWEDRPSEPLAPVTTHPLEFAGVSRQQKRQQILAEMRDQHLHATLLTATPSTAWLLNIRGGDVPFTPLPLGYTLLVDDGSEHGRVQLFMDARKITRDAQEALAADGVEILPPEDLLGALAALPKKDQEKKTRVHVDRASCVLKLSRALEDAGAEVVAGKDLTELPRARKNPAEREGTRQAHIRDGVAITRFLCWLDERIPEGNLTEIEASDALENFRAQGEHFRGLSFPSISGFGPNGAIIHYRATPASNRTFTSDTLYLIDSGGQYSDGTTDITRTVAVGAPSQEMKRRFTLVLKGMIQLTLARFPQKTTGTQLDLLARHALWNAGLNFAHGTGHGVGSFLSVHEGPQSISPRNNDTNLEPGMILSNEPGYYKEEAYGIRIENLIMVSPAEEIEGGETEMLSFETLTLAPIDLRLVLPELLTEQERHWLDAYHSRVRETLAPMLSDKESAWLEQATRSCTATA
jgi:Xaa-Pro aminopeptidase